MSKMVKLASVGALGAAFALLLSVDAFAQPEIGGGYRVSFGQFSSSDAVSENDSNDGSGYAGNFRVDLNLSGEGDNIAYSLQFRGDAKNGATDTGATNENSRDVFAQGSVSWAVNDQFTLAFGNDIGTGTKNVSDVSAGGYPGGGIYLPTDFGVGDGAGLAARLDTGTLQAGFGLSNDAADLTVERSTTADSIAYTANVAGTRTDGTAAVSSETKTGSKNGTLIYVGANLLDDALFLGFRTRTDTTTVAEAATTVNTDLSTLNDLGTGDAIETTVADGEKEEEVTKQGIDIRYSTDTFSVAIESGGESASVDGEDTSDTTGLAIGVTFGAITFANSSSSQEDPDGNVLAETTGLVLEYNILPEVHLVYGSSTATDAAELEDTENFIGAVFKGSF